MGSVAGRRGIAAGPLTGGGGLSRRSVRTLERHALVGLVERHAEVLQHSTAEVRLLKVVGKRQQWPTDLVPADADLAVQTRLVQLDHVEERRHAAGLSRRREQLEL